MLIQASHLSNLVDYASFRGMKKEKLVSSLSDPSLSYCPPYHMINYMEFISVFKKMVEHSGDRFLGLHFGFSLNINALKFITEIALSTTGILQAIHILNAYLKKSFPLVQLEESQIRGQYILEFVDCLSECDIKDQIKDVVYGFIFREIKLMLPPHLEVRLELPTEHLEAYQRFFACEVKGGSSHKMIFSGEITTLEINQKRVQQIELLLPKFLQMLNNNKIEEKPFSSQVRFMILRLCQPELPTFEQVAVHFPMSHRSLQRRLGSEGSCFRSILNEIKSELSFYLSKGYNVQTKEIAFIMGYSCSSAYLHAVQKWR